MKDKHLLLASIMASTAGLILLYFVSAHSTTPLVNISELSYDSVGVTVAVRGEVTSVKNHKDGHIFVGIEDGTGRINTIFFRDTAEKLGDKIECLKKGKTIEVEGEVEEFKGALEIVPNGGADIRCSES